MTPPTVPKPRAERAVDSAERAENHRSACLFCTTDGIYRTLGGIYRTLGGR
ncbi:hypothetical protein [Jatrophihabitans endophyticus]|uniref:hypothetical protein n=1 Tax=Jatrophihabitans endophyticus TaxID=1206085 RepID=UPI001A05D0E8|nr:hypothetical protein [Jatrophihabitans endophyticus]MBE7161045.1 hypothetical protein [Williamsia herbipolensis]MBE7190582.1 hypothetical protein [Jatrophihabitans endophyticus]